jgi:hypothetical protein
MKIYFTCSTGDFFTHEKTYFQIRNHLISQGHLLTRDWLPHTAKLLHDGDTVIRDIKKIYRDNITAIKEADLAIIEDTVSNFSTGHQITVALQYHKPTLVLWQGKKHRQFSQMFIHGIESDILQVSEYNLKQLDSTIDTFIKKYSDIDEKNRFHLVLNNLERRYLDWAQFTTGKSRTQIIRDALRQEIDKNENYNQYLTSH